MAAIKKNHQYYMSLAMRQAKLGKSETSPNPLVGALVVKRGEIIARGYHKKAGLPHAEVIAISAAGKRAKGAQLYVTLEPCTHFGRTGPCVNQIIDSGIKEVIVGTLDPNPVNNGKGIRILRKHGIKVKVGFLENQLRKLNAPFIKHITQKLPFITIKVGQSLDGRIATYRGKSQWITSDKARLCAHHIRKRFDAIMVGANTVISDDPRLQARPATKCLTKIIVDGCLKISPQARLFGNSPVIIATLKKNVNSKTANKKKLAQQAQILEVRTKQGRVNLRDMMKKLAERGITNILVEGGGSLIGSLFDECLVDRALFFISPKIIGGKSALSSVMGRGVADPNKAFKLKNVKFTRIGEDFLIEGDV